MNSRTMPAEWEKHECTWIAWPHHEPDWPGKLDAVRWAYAEIARLLAFSERVEILCAHEGVRLDAESHLDAHSVPGDKYNIHIVPTDRVWLRDSAPTVVRSDKGRELINWKFNGWAKYDNYQRDSLIGPAIEKLTGLPRVSAVRADGSPFVLEGGAFDCDGAGTLLVTEECLLSREQERNPGLDREGYEKLFREYMGITHTIWLGRGCAGDDTHGHVDDVARFVGPGLVALAFENDPNDVNHTSSVENFERLQQARTARGEMIRVIKLPYPRPVVMMGQRLPASYLNFYIANGSVLVPTFNDPSDRRALHILAGLFPGREVIGIHAVDLVWGLGTLHCLTQQQPAEASRQI